MIVKNIDVINYLNILSRFGDKVFPQKISYAITKNCHILNKEYEVYIAALNKILDRYKGFIILDEDGKQILSSDGLPKVDDAHAKELYAEVIELLNVDVPVDLYTIPNELFDYDDGDKYDCLTTKQIIELQSILCEKK